MFIRAENEWFHFIPNNILSRPRNNFIRASKFQIDQNIQNSRNAVVVLIDDGLNDDTLNFFIIRELE